MIVRDYHGWSFEDALDDTHKVVGAVRIKGHIREAEFITGNGQIRQAVYKILQEYDLHPRFKLGNTGTILVTIE
jgi:hypothetical protein